MRSILCKRAVDLLEREVLYLALSSIVPTFSSPPNASCSSKGIIPAVENTENIIKWIPIIVGVSGAVLGVAGMWLIPDFPASDYINALAVGIVSGLASTGLNQIAKQRSK